MFKKDIKILNGTNNLSYEQIGKEIDNYINKIKQNGYVGFYINGQKYVLIYEEMKSIDKYTIVLGDYYE